MSAIDRTQAESVVEAYQALREKCYKAARLNNGALMGDDNWLRHALTENDIEIQANVDGITCHGHTYTTQTMDNEWFSFTIPYDDLTSL